MYRRPDEAERAGAATGFFAAGNWCIVRILKQFGVKVRVLGVVRASKQNSDAVAAFLADHYHSERTSGSPSRASLG
jgi:hypothetical protein